VQTAVGQPLMQRKTSYFDQTCNEFISVSTVLYPRWPPLLKIEIFGTFWLKIEQFWPFEEISIFSNGGHFGYRTAL
jgi:hypothetical protein